MSWKSRKCTFVHLVNQSSASPKLELIILLSSVKGNSSPNLSPVCRPWWNKRWWQHSCDKWWRGFIPRGTAAGGWQTSPEDTSSDVLDAWCWEKVRWIFTSAVSASITDDEDVRLLARNAYSYHHQCCKLSFCCFVDMSFCLFCLLVFCLTCLRKTASLLFFSHQKQCSPWSPIKVSSKCHPSFSTLSSKPHPNLSGILIQKSNI